MLMDLPMVDPREILHGETLAPAELFIPRHFPNPTALLPSLLHISHFFQLI